ncbi:MAG: S9 family peptidase [Acidobacteria bacterium]|nr:S9 family peptidase [Acidobacteriota bacterium]
MRLPFVILLVASAVAQTPSFTLEQVLSAPFPSSLTSSSGGKVAWVSNARGVRNILVAEPPEYRARKVTAYSEDDGQEIGSLRWMPDGKAVVYARGSESRDGTANPASRTAGATEEIWIAALDGSAPRKLGDGTGPAVSPKGDRVAWVRAGAVWWSAPDGKAAQAFVARGAESQLRWSPDGARIAFTSGRGDHSLIGVYDVAGDSLRYLDASTDADSNPEWSPDSRLVAFIRIPSDGLRAVRQPLRSGEPWSIRVANAATGEGHEIWRAKAGRGSVFRGVTARNQLLWGAGGRIVFPWEGDGWTHLYSVSAEGGGARALTPGEFEVEDVDLPAGARDAVYSSNQGDIDRRHLWRVAIAGGTPAPITSGNGIEVAPSGEAFLQSDARRPMHPVVRAGGTPRDLEPLPADFPLSRILEPRQVIFPAADGLVLHGQLFLPPRPSAGARAPAVVFFHGGSRRQMLLGWHPMYYYANAYAMNQYLASLGYVVLSVNYRSGTGYGMEFREAPGYGPAGGSEYADVQGAGLYLRSRAEVDPARIGAWGGSYGGYLTAMALARASDLFRAGVDFHGVHDWARELSIPVTEPDYKVAFESSPMAFVGTWRSPVLLIAGDADPDVQFNQTVMLADALRRKGVEHEVLIFADEVHDFLLWRTWHAAYEAAAKFLAGHLQ